MPNILPSCVVVTSQNCLACIEAIVQDQYVNTLNLNKYDTCLCLLLNKKYCTWGVISLFHLLALHDNLNCNIMIGHL